MLEKSFDYRKENIVSTFDAFDYNEPLNTNISPLLHQLQHIQNAINFLLSKNHFHCKIQQPWFYPRDQHIQQLKLKCCVHTLYGNDLKMIFNHLKLFVEHKFFLIRFNKSIHRHSVVFTPFIVYYCSQRKLFKLPRQCPPSFRGNISYLIFQKKFFFSFFFKLSDPNHAISCRLSLSPFSLITSV